MGGARSNSSSWGRRMEILDIFELFVIELKRSLVSRNWNEYVVAVNPFYNAMIN